MTDTFEIIDESEGFVYTFENDDAFYEWDRTRKTTYVSKREITAEDLKINPIDISYANDN